MQISRRHLSSLCCLLVGMFISSTACTRPTMPSSPSTAASPSAGVSPANARFGFTQVFRVGQSVTYVDGLVIVLDAINDSRCRPNVQCVWAGELAPQLTLSGGKVGAAQTVLLGTQRARERKLAGYRLALLDASGDAATLIVTRRTAAIPADPAPVKGGSGVHGVVMIGPSCPVVRVPPDPNCGDKPYAATFFIDTAAGARVATVASGADGSFSIRLRPGAYVIRLQSSAMLPRMEPQAFTVTAHARTRLRLSLDSGMR